MRSKPSRTAFKGRTKEKDGRREKERKRDIQGDPLLLALPSPLSSFHLRPSLRRFSLSLANIAHAPIIVVNSGILRILELSRIPRRKKETARKRVATGTRIRGFGRQLLTCHHVRDVFSSVLKKKNYRYSQFLFGFIKVSCNNNLYS